MSRQDRSAHFFPRLGVVVGLLAAAAASTGCNWKFGAADDLCNPGDNECIDKKTTDKPGQPVKEQGHPYKALELGDNQCSQTGAGNHLGNPVSSTGWPTLIGPSGNDVPIIQPAECVPFRFFMNYCNFGVATSSATQDNWVLLDSDMFQVSNPSVQIPALDSCKCASVEVPVSGLPSQRYQLDSLAHPGGSFPLPFNFSVPATSGGLTSCN